MDKLISCRTCGKEVKKKVHQHVFCSAKCRTENWVEIERQRRKHLRGWRYRKRVKVNICSCSICGYEYASRGKGSVCFPGCRYGQPPRNGAVKIYIKPDHHLSYSRNEVVERFFNKDLLDILTSQHQIVNNVDNNTVLQNLAERNPHFLASWSGTEIGESPADVVDAKLTVRSLIERYCNRKRSGGVGIRNKAVRLLLHKSDAEIAKELGVTRARIGQIKEDFFDWARLHI